MGSVEHMKINSESNGENLKYLIETARTALDKEFEVSGRYETKVRGQMTMAGSWFAVVQAVAAIVLDQQLPTDSIAALTTFAVLAGVALFIAMLKSAEVWKLRVETTATHRTLDEMMVNLERDSQSFQRNLVTQYRNFLGKAQKANEERADAVERATVFWWAALFLTFVELVVAFLLRAMYV